MKTNKHGLRANMYIRWLGAFRGKNFSTFESIQFEINRPAGEEAACEPIWFGENTASIRTYIIPESMHHNNISAIVGLLVNREDVFKVFPIDCWSEYGQPDKEQNPSRLYYGHKSFTKYGAHGEAWFKKTRKTFMGIIVYDYYNQPTELKREIRAAAIKFGLKVYTQDQFDNKNNLKINKIKEVKNF